MPVLRDITLGRFVPGDSGLHRRDPRVKILAAAALMGALMATESGAALVGVQLVLVALARLSSIPVRLLLGNLRPLAPLLLLTVGLNALLMPGEPVWDV